MNALAITFTYTLAIWVIVALVVEAITDRVRARRAINRRIAASMSTKVPAKAPLNNRTLNIIQPSRV